MTIFLLNMVLQNAHCSFVGIYIEITIDGIVLCISFYLWHCSVLQITTFWAAAHVAMCTVTPLVFSAASCSGVGLGAHHVSPHIPRKPPTPSCHTQAQRTSSYVFCMDLCQDLPRHRLEDRGQRAPVTACSPHRPQGPSHLTTGVPRLGEDPRLGSDISHYRNVYKEICRLGSKVLA